MPTIELARFLPKPVAFVLAGGASYGAVQVGHLRALAETDIEPDLVVGTSVGALNGALVAEDPKEAPARLSELWSSIVRRDVFGNTVGMAVSMVSGQPSATRNDGLRALIERSLTSRDFSDLALPHTAIATDFDTGDVVLINDGDLVSALLASAAIPLVFPQVPRDGRNLVDGGLVANVPIAAAAAQGAESMVVLDCGFTVVAPERNDTYVGLLMRTAAIMAAQQVRRDLEKVADKTVLYLPGPWPITSRPDEFGDSDEMASEAYDLALEWLSTLHLEGSGRYGETPADFLTKRRRVRPPEPAEDETEEVGLVHSAAGAAA
ncbi:MAG: patatin-like phospholipase family protein, partial [Candidatus Nanopelagicales bacterium]|nr:patatin-like phospholipase family protein [Candidatus Nanopelagicales bacterium]